MTLADSHYLEDLRSLRESREQYRAAFEAARDAMVMTDDGGLWVDVNRAAADLLGRPPNHLIGRRLWDFLVPRPGSVPVAGARAGDRREPFFIDLMCGDDTIRTTELVIRPLLPGCQLLTLREVARAAVADGAGPARD